MVATRAEVGSVAFHRVGAVNCLEEQLRGLLPSRPAPLLPVCPRRVPEQAGGQIANQGDEDDPDLYQMDPIEFEDLTAGVVPRPHGASMESPCALNA